MTRTEAAHTNGVLSHGPKTEAGKAVSSRNAIRHGLTAADVVLPGEDAAAFEALLDNICIDYMPATEREYDLAFEMASARWRIRRVTLMEKAAIECELRRDHPAENASQAATPDTPEMAWARAWAAAANCSALKQVHRHDTRLHRQYDKARTELMQAVSKRLELEANNNKVHPSRLELRDHPQAAALRSNVRAQVAANAASANAAAANVAAAVPNEPDLPAPATAAAPRPAVQNEPDVVHLPPPPAQMPATRMAAAA